MQLLKKMLTHGLIIFGLSLGLIVSAVASNFATTEFLAKQGNATAQAGLGSIYWLGQEVQQDYTKAFYWHQKAAHQGIVFSKFTLGTLYEAGAGVRQNKSQAKQWYGDACDSGYQDGCNSYRILNEQGY